MARPEPALGASSQDDGPLIVVCCGGSLPYAVAAAAAARGRRVVLFALRGVADPLRVAEFPHHWIALGQGGRFLRLARQERGRDMVWIGALIRPSITQLRFDLTTLRALPRLFAAFRGGDNHLLSSMGRVFEDLGIRFMGAHEVAPELLVPLGVAAGPRPEQRHRVDIARALAILEAMGPFDIGQGVVVADQHCIAVEGAEGTDGLLLRVADMRRNGRVSAASGTGAKSAFSRGK